MTSLKRKRSLYLMIQDFFTVGIALSDIIITYILFLVN
uniref:Uncharacterized protein n=1 Tax=Siphoviridae sp. ctHl62 TaxID=2826235 RepID=A0A8S5MGI9_9CAUD|nr:MAG TPA: hypothetical protein [Siphoviridae sp. ctHl62]